MLVNPKDDNIGSALAVASAVAAPQQAELKYSLSLRHVLVVLFTRRRQIAIVAAAILLSTLLAILLLPARYRSEAKLLVRLGRESVVIDPTARIGQAAVPMEGRDKEINSEIELLKSRKLTEAIVAQIGPNRLLGRKQDTTYSAKDTAEAIARVEEKVGVEAIPDSNILAISYDSPDAELSRDVVARLIDAYLDERAHVYRNQGDLKFFQDQLESARRQQAQVQRKLRELRDSTGVANPEEQRTILLKRVDSIQHDIDAAKADLAAVVSSIDALSRQLAQMPAKHVIEERSGAAMDSLDTARTRLSEMRLQEVDLASRYKEDARPLKIIRRKIAEAENELTAMAAETSQKTVGINHTFEELNLRREGELANQSSLNSRILALEAARTKAQSGLAWIDDVAVKTQSLEQEITLAASNVSRYGEAYEQARIDQQMGQARIGNISVAEPPVLPLRPKGPSRSLLALAGLFLAISLGLGSAFVADALDHTIHRVEHLRSLGLPQIVSIPCVSDYYAPYHQALSPGRRAALAHGAARPLDDEMIEADAQPVRPLRALLRESADPSAAGARAPATRNFSDMDLSSGATLVITDERGTASIHLRHAGNADRPAGPLAVSPRILAAIRGAVDHLIPLDSRQAAPRVIGIVGARSGEGSSTVSVHLAIALAHRVDTGLNQPSTSNRVLLLDTDVESPTSSLLAGAASARGLGDWVAMRTADTQTLSDLIMPTRQHLLDVLPAGAPRERSPLGPRMPLVLQAMGQSYRHVVVDLPSVMDSEATAQVAGLCDTVVFVCQANELRVEAAQQTLRRLRDAGAKISLALLNKRRYPVPEWAYRLS